MTKEEEFDSFMIGSFLDLYHIMEARIEAEEERRKNDKGSSEATKDIQSEGQGALNEDQGRSRRHLSENG